MNEEKTMFRWIEDWTNNTMGVAGEYYKTYEEAYADAVAHVASLRLTKREMEDSMRKGKSCVVVEKCTFDADGEEESFEQVGAIVVIDETTVDRIY